MECLLAGGDRRSIGPADEVADLVRRTPAKLVGLIECLWSGDPIVRMRAADATEKIARDQAALIQPYKSALMELAAESTQPEVCWHLAVILPRLKLSRGECQSVAETLQTYLSNRSSIVKTFALQGLFDLTLQYSSLRSQVMELVRLYERTGTPAMRARCRKLSQVMEPREASSASKKKRKRG